MNARLMLSRVLFASANQIQKKKQQPPPSEGKVTHVLSVRLLCFQQLQEVWWTLVSTHYVLESPDHQIQLRMRILEVVFLLKNYSCNIPAEVCIIKASQSRQSLMF